MKTLLPYQEEGARFLATHKRALLADEAGLGKTLQAIRACDHVGAQRVLVICPPSVVINWRREFAESSLLDPELDVITPARMARRSQYMADEYDAIIVDEAHYYKSPRTDRTKSLYGLPRRVNAIVDRAPHVFLLTATPAPNDPSEVWTHIYALRPELIPDHRGGEALSQDRFTTIYCQVKQTPWGPRIMGLRPSKIEVFRKMIGKFMLRRLEQEVDLPELRISPLYVEAEVVRADRSEAAEQVAKALDEGGLKALTKLSEEMATLRRLLGIGKVDPVLEYIGDWLECNEGKLCVYAYHTEVIQTMLTKLSKIAVSITGTTTNRQAVVDRFQTDDSVRVFIGQMRAAGEAITLTQATEILLVEPSWVPADNYQVIKRIHRIGQTKPCSARFVTVAGSIDEKINKALARKEAMLADMMG